jgi:signal transduction histidine kinase
MPGVWRSNAYILASFPIGGLAFTYFVTMLSLGLGLLIIWLGIPVLVATVASAKWFARGERRRAGWLLRQPILSLYLPPHRRGMLGYLHTAIGDSAVWKDLVWLVILLPVFGLCAFTLAVCFWATALGIIFMPVWSWSIPGGVDWGLFTIDTIHEAFAVIPLGVVLFALTIPFTRALAMGMGSFAGSLLAPSERRRVAELERTRAGAVDAQAAELQRIERDLHDGAQARLVALALDLGMAEERFARDPDGARELVGEAREEAKRALAELRDLARGLRPSLLAERGLGPALTALAARSPIPASIDLDVPDDLPRAIENATWFVVSEALANAGKHSRAQRVLVTVLRTGDTLIVEVVDDGAGGASAEGNGLTGLRKRVEALDGHLSVTSPAGGPTSIRAELPCAS